MPVIDNAQQILLLSKRQKVSVEDLAKVKYKDFSNEEFYQRVFETIADSLYSTEPGKASQYLTALKTALENNERMREINPALFNKYQQVANYLRWNCLSLITLPEIEELFNKHIMLALDWDININEKIRFLFLDYFERIDDYRKKSSQMLRGLKENKEVIGAQEFILDDISVKNNIKNWLTDYNRFFKSGKRRGSVEEISYINQSPNVKKLSKKEKNILNSVIRVYDFLRFSPSLRQRVEMTRPTGTRRVPVSVKQPVTPTVSAITKAEESRPVGIKPKSKRTLETTIVEQPQAQQPKQPAISDEIKHAYEGDAKLEGEIAVEESNLSQEVQNNATLLRSEFFKAVQLRNANRTIAAFRLLARIKDLDKFLAHDQNLQKFLSTTWQQKYGKSFTDEFEQDPYQAKFVKAFIRYVLETRLSMSENDSARVAAKLANIFKQTGQEKYKKIAYYDLKDKTFKYLDDTQH